MLHFEITVNGKTALKIIAGSWLEAKREKTKWLRNHRKMAKKHAKKTGYTKKWKNFKNQDARKMGGRKYWPKPKKGGLESLVSVHITDISLLKR